MKVMAMPGTPILMLTSINHPNDGARFELAFGEHGGTIGRGGHNTHSLSGDRTVSWNHCSIRWDGEHFWLFDTSSNGVFVNGARKRMDWGSKVLIAEDDQIVIGPYRFRARIVRTADGSKMPPALPRRLDPRDEIRMLETWMPALADQTGHGPRGADLPARPVTGSTACDAFLIGAGLDPAEAGIGQDPVEMMRRAGAGYRAMAAALHEVGKAARKPRRGAVAVTQANNPLRNADGADEAIWIMLLGSVPGYLDAEAAVADVQADLQPGAGS